MNKQFGTYMVKVKVAISWHHRYVLCDIPDLSFSFIFVFSNQHFNFYNKKIWKNVFDGAGICTHDLQNMSRLP